MRLEDQLQVSVATYLDLRGLTWCHVPNEGKRSVVTGSQNKRKGLKAGVPDVLIFNPHGEYRGLAIELKVGKNKQTDTQKQWQIKLINCGWKYEICYTFDQALKLIEETYGA